MNAWTICCNQLMGTAPPPCIVIHEEPPPPKTTQCVWCGDDFPFEALRQYCDDECRNAMALAKARERRAIDAAK